MVFLIIPRLYAMFCLHNIEISLGSQTAIKVRTIWIFNGWQLIYISVVATRLTLKSTTKISIALDKLYTAKEISVWWFPFQRSGFGGDFRAELVLEKHI